MDKVYDLVIVGGGPGGYTAALYAARAGLSTVVLEKLSAGGQMALTHQIDNYPGFEEGIDGFTLAEKMQQGAERFGAVTELAEVTSMDLQAQPKKVETSEGTFYGRAVILATGASPRELGLPNEQALVGSGVHYCAACDGMFYKDKTVVVVGGGNSAAADALLLSRVAAKVIIVHRRDTLRATKVYHEPLQKAENVEFLWNTTVEELLQGDRLSGIRVRDTVTGEDKGAFDFLKANYPELKLYPTVHAAMRFHSPGERSDFVAIGQKAAHFTNTPHFVNVVEGGGMLGYQAVLKTMELLEEAAREEKDLRSLIQIKGMGCGGCI